MNDPNTTRAYFKLLNEMRGIAKRAAHEYLTTMKLTQHERKALRRAMLVMYDHGSMDTRKLHEAIDSLKTGKVRGG